MLKQTLLCPDEMDFKNILTLIKKNRDVIAFCQCNKTIPITLLVAIIHKATGFK